MAEADARGDLKDRPSSPVHEDMRLQKIIWATERVAWIVMVFIVILALLGAFSMGVLSSAETVSPAGTRISHDRILRDGRAYDFVITRSGLEPGADTEIALAGFDFSGQEIESIRPESSAHEAGVALTKLLFKAGEDGSLKVNLRIRPQSPGPGDVGISVGGEPPVRARFFVLP